ncbi:MAG: hypothetical protein HY735_34710 [Verrucomicrobia bacterium]|nr:hypothetical protein [Verrucomicrobiota bacterium]
MSPGSAPAVRSLASAQVNPPGPFEVTITITPPPNVTVLVVEEQLPTGWTATSINSGGSVDPNFNKVKWGPVFNPPSAPVTYRYQAVPTAEAQGVFTLSGLAAFDGTVINIGGENKVIVGGGTAVSSVTLRAGVSDGNIVLFWPTNAVGWVLEVSENLATSPWTRVSALPTVSAENNSLKIPISDGSRFYRLRGP